MGDIIHFIILVVPTTCPEGCQNGQKGLRGDDGPTGPRGSLWLSWAPRDMLAPGDLEELLVY